MIKINLLPSNIFEARAIKRVIALFAIILIAVVAVSLVMTQKLNKESADLQQQTKVAADLKQQADTLASQASSLLAQIAPIESKIKFIDDVKAHNLVYPKLYEELAKFTYKKIIYSSLQSDGSALTITAYTPSLKDTGRYLLNMYRATHIFSSVTISGVPGYPYAGAAPGGGGVGIPGGMGGMAAPAMAPALPGPTGAGFGQQSSMSRVPTVDSQGQSLAVSMTGGPGGYEAPPGGFGGTTYGGIDAISAGVGKAEQKQNTGFQLTVTCRLANPIIAPAAPGTGTGQAMPGMGGMPGGMPGGTSPIPGSSPIPGGPRPSGS